jgi:hypothetical protein
MGALCLLVERKNNDKSLAPSRQSARFIIIQARRRSAAGIIFSETFVLCVFFLLGATFLCGSSQTN